MSQKHAKRRHSTKKRVTAPAQESEFASDGRRKRMNPAARNLLFISLIILALSEVLVRTNTVTELVANLICIPALIALEQHNPLVEQLHHIPFLLLLVSKSIAGKCMYTERLFVCFLSSCPHGMV